MFSQEHRLPIERDITLDASTHHQSAGVVHATSTNDIVRVLGGIQCTGATNSTQCRPFAHSRAVVPPATAVTCSPRPLPFSPGERREGDR